MNFRTASWCNKASRVLYDLPNSFSINCRWMNLWQSRQMSIPLVFISSLVKFFLNHLFVWQVRGIRWWKNNPLLRPHKAQTCWSSVACIVWELNTNRLSAMCCCFPAITMYSFFHISFHSSAIYFLATKKTRCSASGSSIGILRSSKRA